MLIFRQEQTWQMAGLTTIFMPPSLLSSQMRSPHARDEDQFLLDFLALPPELAKDISLLQIFLFPHTIMKYSLGDPLQKRFIDF